jgi:hypothetical protein
VTATVTVQASAVTAASAADYPTNRVADPITRLLSTQINAGVTLTGNQVPQAVTFWFPLATNAGQYQGVGSYVMTGIGQSFPFMRLVPATTTNWYFYAMTGVINGDPNRLYSDGDLAAMGAFKSSVFGVGGLAAPSSSAVTGISATTIFANSDNAGNQWAELDHVAWTDPTDPNVWLVKFYVRETDSSGSPASDANGSWREWIEYQVLGGARTSAPGPWPKGDALAITYRASTDTHHYLQIQCVAVNRLSTNPGDWAGTDTASSVAQGSVIQQNFGLPPTGVLPSSVWPVPLNVILSPLNSPYTVSSPGVCVDGTLWLVFVTQDLFGAHVVTFGTGLYNPPLIDAVTNSAPLTSCTVTFQAVGGQWLKICEQLGFKI